ncbi:DUF2867 domain-containing protein [Streptomyces sp. B1866]|uniref:DUF2867 domain-containing protein n=1 Tax=Streptomyces sp. B1866 TaxID=3075431 RepID=UPI00288F581B|nr:DUF2867 domain-containing protein [Streptomyces sp. B1866]MDT3398008.1 DUF2867 domain-containing protein [Streptomyces sp. B1866]
MRLPKTEYTSRPWRIHEFAQDFKLEDLWRLPTPGGPDDLKLLVRQFATVDDQPDRQLSPATRALFAVRWQIGRVMGWDKPDTGVNKRVPSLRDRLPADLLEGPRGPDLPTKPFTSVYQTDTEWVSELANSTVHALMHIGWVSDDAGGYHAQMGVLVKTNGVLGKAYMAAILPLRYTIVYPSLIRTIGRGWEQRKKE